MKKLLKGFTLIELMIVVAIIGILAAIAIPNFVKFQCRSKQSEAKGNLKGLYVANEAYRGEYDTYLINQTNFGFTPKGAKMRYAYTVTAVSSTHSDADATTTSQELSSDKWIIDETNNLSNSVKGCL